MKKLIFLLLFVPIVSFGQGLGYGRQTSTYDVTVKDDMNPIFGKKYKVEVESSLPLKPRETIDISPFLELSKNLMEKANRIDSNNDRWARSQGYNSFVEYKREQSEIRKASRRLNRLYLSKKEIKQPEAMKNEEDAIAREGEKMEAESKARKTKNKTKELEREEENYYILKESEIFVGQVLYTTLAVFLSVKNERDWIVDSEIIVPKNAQVTIIGKAYDDRFVKVKFQDKVGFLLLEILHK